MRKPINNHSRRDFLKLAGSATLVGALHHPVLGNSPWAVPQRFLKNEDEREQYALDLLKRLCAEGPRPTGSPQYARGIGIIKEEMERSLSSVRYEDYKFEQWESISESEFFIGRQYIETRVFHGSPSTPLSGATGVLDKIDNRYFLVDPSTKEKKAMILISGYGRAISGNFHRQKIAKDLNIPVFGVGKQDKPLVDRAIEKQISTNIKAQVRFNPDRRGINAVGQIPGQTKDEILILAHADTVYTSLGAIDNTASVVGMLMLAHELTGSKPKHTITFLATDAEEYTYLGAKNYVERRMADGSIKNIKTIINFDSLVWGPNLWFYTLNSELHDIARDVHNDLKMETTPVFESKDAFILDVTAFKGIDARAVLVDGRGYNDKTLPLYHRMDDEARHVPLDCMESSFQVLREYIKRIDTL